MIFNCNEQNHAGGVKPKGFRLPQVAKIRDRLVFNAQRSGWWMCKLDLSNCFWIIRLPAPWRHSFEVYVPGEGGGGTGGPDYPLGGLSAP